MSCYDRSDVYTILKAYAGIADEQINTILVEYDQACYDQYKDKSIPFIRNKELKDKTLKELADTKPSVIAEIAKTNHSKFPGIQRACAYATSNIQREVDSALGVRWTFGKHIGEYVHEVFQSDEPYLRWMYHTAKNLDTMIRTAIEEQYLPEAVPEAEKSHKRRRTEEGFSLNEDNIEKVLQSLTPDALRLLQERFSSKLSLE